MSKWATMIFMLVVTTNMSVFGDFPQQEKFSWLNEENVLKKLIQELDGKGSIHRFYVDLGAGDGVTMSNTTRLALDGWKGLAVELDSKSANTFLENYRNLHDVTFDQSKITPLNVVDILRRHQVPHNFDVLSLDIDGYDYFVLEAILQEYRPTIIITEINEKIPPPLEFTVLFNEDYVWEANCFYGQSISKLKKLATSTGYALVHLEYNNAFLICKEAWNKKDLTAQEAYLAGYQNNTKRAHYFPWNACVDHLLEGSPAENFQFLNQFFEKYQGKYVLEMGTNE